MSNKTNINHDYSNLGAGLFFRMIGVPNCTYDDCVPYNELMKFIKEAGDPTIINVNKRLNQCLIDDNITGVITFDKDAYSDCYHYIAEIEFKNPADRQECVGMRNNPLYGADIFVTALARAVSIMRAWLDEVEADRFEEKLQKEALQAGLVLEMRTSETRISTFYLYREAYGECPDFMFFEVDSRDPHCQEKLTSAIEAYASKDLMHKITQQFPMIPVVYHYDSFTFEVPHPLRAGFMEEQLKHFSNLDETYAKHAFAKASHMGLLPITRRNLAFLLKVMDDTINGLESKLN